MVPTVVVRAVRYGAEFALILFALSGCGGGSSDSTPTQSVAVEPAPSASVPTGGDTSSIAVVPGEIAIRTVSINPTVYLNQEEKLTFSIQTDSGLPETIAWEARSSNAEGAVPAIDTVGLLTWKPNDKDHQTQPTIAIYVKLSSGQTGRVNIKPQVLAERVVFRRTNPESGRYQIKNDSYVFDVFQDASVSNASSFIEIKEYYTPSGGYTWSVISSEDIAHTMIVAPDASTSRVDAGSKSVGVAKKLAVAADVYPLSEIPVGQMRGGAFGSLQKTGGVAGKGLSSGGLNVYTSRIGSVTFKSISSSRTENITWQLAPQKIFNYYSSCVESIHDARILNTCRIKSENKSPIILIHGFSGGDSTVINDDLEGGGKDTWGQTPSVFVDAGHPVFEMRWHTYIPFEDAAGALAKFATEVASFTGKKPIVLAHSFGGIVAHLALQDKGRFWVGAAGHGNWRSVSGKELFSKVITLNSPLSGANGAKSWNGNYNSVKKLINPSGVVGDVQFPMGQDIDDTSIYSCWSITCVQAGVNFSGDLLDLKSLRTKKMLIDGDKTLKFTILDVQGGLNDLREGESIFSLQKGVLNGQEDAEVITVTGFRNYLGDSNIARGSTRYTYSAIGDGLISLIGQALIPQDLSGRFTERLPAEPGVFFQFESSNLTTLRGNAATIRSLAKDDCLIYNASDRKYLMCGHSAHTASKQSHNFSILSFSRNGNGAQRKCTNEKITEDLFGFKIKECVQWRVEVIPSQTVNLSSQEPDFAVARIDSSSNHFLKLMISDGRYFAASPVNYSGNLASLSVAQISGKTVQNSVLQGTSRPFAAGDVPLGRVQIWLTFWERTSNSARHAYRAGESGSDGRFSFDLGSVFSDIFGPAANIANYRASLKFVLNGYKAAAVTIDDIRNSVELGDVVLTSDSQIAPPGLVVPISISGFSANQLVAGGAIQGAFAVVGRDLRMLRVHAGSNATATNCYLDLPAREGPASFAFNGEWTPENGRSCAALMPAAGVQSTIVFKVEARDSLGNIANNGLPPTTSAIYARPRLFLVDGIATDGIFYVGTAKAIGVKGDLLSPSALTVTMTAGTCVLDGTFAHTAVQVNYVCTARSAGNEKIQVFKSDGQFLLDRDVTVNPSQTVPVNVVARSIPAQVTLGQVFTLSMTTDRPALRAVVDWSDGTAQTSCGALVGTNCGLGTSFSQTKLAQQVGALTYRATFYDVNNRVVATADGGTTVALPPTSGTVTTCTGINKLGSRCLVILDTTTDVQSVTVVSSAGPGTNAPTPLSLISNGTFSKRFELRPGVLVDTVPRSNYVVRMTNDRGQIFDLPFGLDADASYPYTVNGLPTGAVISGTRLPITTTFAVQYNVQMRLVIDNDVGRAINFDQASVANLDTSGLSPGNHTWTIEGYREGILVATRQSGSFTVVAATPTITSIAVSSGKVLVGDANGALLTVQLSAPVSALTVVMQRPDCSTFVNLDLNGYANASQTIYSRRIASTNTGIYRLIAKAHRADGTVISVAPTSPVLQFVATAPELSTPQTPADFSACSAASVPTPSMAVDFSATAIAALNTSAVSGGVSFITGKDGRPAAKFGGVAQPGHIRISNRAATQFTDAATFDVWVRVDSLIGMDGNGRTVTDGAYAMAVVAKSHDRIGGAMMVNSLTRPENAMWLQSYDVRFGGSTCVHLPRAVVPMGTWARLTYVLSSTGGVQGYLNGQLTWNCPGARPDFTAMNSNDIYIGKFSDFWYPLNGAVQDLKIYKSALTAAEIASLP